MIPVKHDLCNEIYFERGARRWGDRAVAPMPVQRTENGGRDCFVTHWKPSPAELSQLLSGGAVLLRVFGSAHPVVNVETAP